MKKLILTLAGLIAGMMVFAQKPDSNKIVITDRNDYTEIRIGDSVFKITHDYMARERLNSGIKKGAEGDYSGAVSEFNTALIFDATIAEIYYNRGLAYYYLNDFLNAKKDYSTAIGLDSNYYRAYNERGIIKCKQGSYFEGADDFKKAIRIDSTYAASYFNLGVSYLQMNNTTEACEQLLIAKEKGYPQSIEVYSEYCE